MMNTRLDSPRPFMGRIRPALVEAFRHKYGRNPQTGEVAQWKYVPFSLDSPDATTRIVVYDLSGPWCAVELWLVSSEPERYGAAIFSDEDSLVTGEALLRGWLDCEKQVFTQPTLHDGHPLDIPINSSIEDLKEILELGGRPARLSKQTLLGLLVEVQQHREIARNASHTP